MGCAPHQRFRGHHGARAHRIQVPPAGPADWKASQWERGTVQIPRVWKRPPHLQRAGQGRGGQPAIRGHAHRLPAEARLPGKSKLLLNTYYATTLLVRIIYICDQRNLDPCTQ